MLSFARFLGICLCIAGLLVTQVGSIEAAQPGTTPVAAEAITTTAAAITTTATATVEVANTPAPVERAPLIAPAAGPTFQNTVHGLVINWAYRNEANFPVSISGGGWSLEANTDTNAEYKFETLGEGVAILNPVIATGSGLHPMSVDLAVPIAGPPDRMVNLGVYGGDQYPTGLPMSIQMKPSAPKVNPGTEVQFVIDLKNAMPHTVHEVVVTDLMPDGLVPTYAESSVGTPWIGGQLAAASIGQLDQGQGAVVTITAQLAPNASAEEAVTNRASVIYQESVALQASATINGETPTQLPETGTATAALPLGGFALLVAIVALRKIRLNHA